MKVPFYRHNLNKPRYKEALAQALENEFLTTGPICNQVTQRIKQLLDCSSAIMTSSWTSGAQAFLRYLKNQYYKDQHVTVLTSSLTFCATANVAVNEGFDVELLDVDPKTLHVTNEMIENAVSNNQSIKIVIYVHLYGYYSDLSSLYAYLKKRNILLIEDCAHCFEAQGVNGSKPGSQSDAAIFSFYATKNLSCGEGGAIVSNQFDLTDCVSPYLLHGMSKGAFDRHRTSNTNVYDVRDIGIKANMSDINASLLLPQLDNVSEIVKNRTSNASLYRNRLKNSNVRIASLTMKNSDTVHANHLMPILVPANYRDELRTYLSTKGIGTAVNFPSLFTLSYYSHYQKDLSSMPNSVVLGNQLISLPFYESLEDQEIDYVCNHIDNFLASKNV